MRKRILILMAVCQFLVSAPNAAADATTVVGDAPARQLFLTGDSVAYSEFSDNSRPLLTIWTAKAGQKPRAFFRYRYPSTWYDSVVRAQRGIIVIRIDRQQEEEGGGQGEVTESELYAGSPDGKADSLSTPHQCGFGETEFTMTDSTVMVGSDCPSPESEFSVFRTVGTQVVRAFSVASTGVTPAVPPIPDTGHVAIWLGLRQLSTGMLVASWSLPTGFEYVRQSEATDDGSIVAIAYGLKTPHTVFGFAPGVPTGEPISIPAGFRFLELRSGGIVLVEPIKRASRERTVYKLDAVTGSLALFAITPWEDAGSGATRHETATLPFSSFDFDQERVAFSHYTCGGRSPILLKAALDPLPPAPDCPISMSKRLMTDGNLLRVRVSCPRRCIGGVIFKKGRHQFAQEFVLLRRSGSQVLTLRMSRTARKWFAKHRSMRVRVETTNWATGRSERLARTVRRR